MMILKWIFEFFELFLVLICICFVFFFYLSGHVCFVCCLFFLFSLSPLLFLLLFPYRVWLVSVPSLLPHPWTLNGGVPPGLAVCVSSGWAGGRPGSRGSCLSPHFSASCWPRRCFLWLCLLRSEGRRGLGGVSSSSAQTEDLVPSQGWLLLLVCGELSSLPGI